MKKCLFLVIFLFFCSSAYAKPPFNLDEQLNYRTSWNFIPVGEASLEVKGIESIEGKPFYHFVASTKCTLFFLLYRIESKIESFVQPDSFLPAKYIAYIKRGKRDRRDTVLYDQENHLATWNHFRLGKSLEEHHEKEIMKIPLEVQDPLSAFYYLRNKLRTEKVKPGDVISVPVNADRKNWEIKVKVLSRETRRFQGKSRKVLIVEPEAWFQAAFFTPGRMIIWLTDDEKKIPLYMQGSIPFGIITLSLQTKLD